MHPLDFCFFFFNDTATTEIYTLSLHDALPICDDAVRAQVDQALRGPFVVDRIAAAAQARAMHLGDQCGIPQRMVEHRSEEHTSELQSQSNLVCRLLLEKKKRTVQRRSGYSTEC